MANAVLYNSDGISVEYGEQTLTVTEDKSLKICSVDVYENFGTFTLPPNQEGHKEAEKIIKALQKWIQTTKEPNNPIKKEKKESKEDFVICPGCCWSDGLDYDGNGNWMCHRCGDEWGE
jgi:hypothetical protein